MWVRPCGASRSAAYSVRSRRLSALKSCIRRGEMAQLSALKREDLGLVKNSTETISSPNSPLARACSSALLEEATCAASLLAPSMSAVQGPVPTLYVIPCERPTARRAVPGPVPQASCRRRRRRPGRDDPPLLLLPPRVARPPRDQPLQGDVIRVHGESMERTLPGDCFILMDGRRRTPLRSDLRGPHARGAVLHRALRESGSLGPEQ